ncbi:trypsin-like serine peptidase [Streptomyces sp. NPDC085466]|uniref:trypsin-like serine peptidase n=1 Tax=Streptomyces sp. NPDC085466 TaxID=3365725 RepID=UPI0037CD7E24
MGVLAASLTVAAASLVGAAAPAGAEEGSTVPVGPAGAERGSLVSVGPARIDVPGSAGKPREEQEEALRAYWTPERVEEAVRAGDARTGKAGTMPARAAGPVPGRTIDQVGKILFNFPGGQPGSCTGTVVDSPSGRIVITAGHCIEHGGPDGEWFTNFAFLPAYENGEEPLGLFTVANVATDGLWASDEDETHDYGVLVISDNAEGETVADVAGALPLRTTPSAVTSVHVTGYPAAGGYDGRDQHHCEGLTEPTLPPRDLIWVNCPNMERGASGGPWLHGFDATTQEGEIYGVNTILDDLGNVYTPRFDSRTLQLVSIMDMAAGAM